PRKRAVLCSELETAPAMRCLTRASASMKKATVEPVPTPTMLPSSTYSMAFSPARRLASDMSGLLEGKKQLPLRRRHRQHRQARALADQRELLAQRIGVGADLVQRQRPLQVAHVAHVDQIPARLFARGLGVEVLGLAVELGLVRVGRGNDLADAVDARDFAVGVVEQHPVADLHLAHEVARLVVAHPGPRLGADPLQVVDRKIPRFGFHQPIALAFAHVAPAMKVRASVQTAWSGTSQGSLAIAST